MFYTFRGYALFLSNTTFDYISISDKSFLISFAIRSNDIYGTRKVSEKIAREVFDIPEISFTKGYVEFILSGDEVVGFYALKDVDGHDQDWTGELGHLFVKAGMQGRGIGTLLFYRAVEKAKGKGWMRMVWLSDPDAEYFYKKMGARVIGYDENLLNPGVALPIFEYYIENRDR